MHFNPRARVGRDVFVGNYDEHVTIFQSTRPRGARQREPFSLSDCDHFNPRARVGRDLKR